MRKKISGVHSQKPSETRCSVVTNWYDCSARSIRSALLQLINLMELGQRSAASEAWVRHLASVLAEGAKNHPEIFLSELANLIMTEESGASALGSDPPIFVNQYSIDQKRAERRLGNFLDESTRSPRKV